MDDNYEETNNVQADWSCRRVRFRPDGLVTYLDRTKSQAVIKPGDAGQAAGSDDAGSANVSERVPSLDSVGAAHAVG